MYEEASETMHEAPKHMIDVGEDIVQTTTVNPGYENNSSKKIPCPFWA